MAQGRERKAAGPVWGGGDDPYLCADELGEPYRPNSLSDRFEVAQAAPDVPPLTFHGLRHTSATIALDDLRSGEGLANRAVGAG